MALLAGRDASLFENPKFRKLHPRLCAVSRRHNRTVVQSHSLDRRKSRATSTDLRQRRIGMRTAAGRCRRRIGPCGRTASRVGQTVGMHLRLSRVFLCRRGVELAYLADKRLSGVPVSHQGVSDWGRG